MTSGEPPPTASQRPSITPAPLGCSGVSVSRGPRTRPPPLSRASVARIRAVRTGSGAAARAAASTTSGRSPAARSASAASRPGSPPRSSRCTRPLPVPSAAATRSVVRHRSGSCAPPSSGPATRTRPCSLPSTSSSPSRWAVTRSGTRNTRESRGRSASSTSTRPDATRGADGEKRKRPEPAAGSPQSSRARSIVARRRVRSSLR